MSGKGESVKETPQQRAMVELALQRVQDYKQRWLPVQKNLAQSVADMGASGSAQRRAAQGLASTDTAARFAGAADKLEAGLASRGGLGSSQSKLAITGLGEDRAASTGLGLTQAEQQIDDAYTAGLGSIMALGQGQKADAIRGVADTAGMSGRRAAADANASLQNRMGNAALVGQVAGAGLAMYGAGAGGGISGTNDLSGVSGSNALDKWAQFGVGGD